MLLVVRHGYQKLPRDPRLTGNEKQKRETAIREAKAIYRDEVWEKKNEVAINMKIAVSADRQTLSIPLHRAISMQNSTPILLALPNFMTKSKYLNFLAYALKTYWMRLEESARARRKEIRWTPSKVAAGGRRREKEKNVFDRQWDEILHWASREEEEASESREWKSVIGIEDWNQNGDSFCDSPILLRGNSPLNRQRFLYRGEISLRKNKRAVMSNVLGQERREQIKT